MISTKLEKNHWFAGEQISEIDCTIYAYLAILQHIGVSNNALRTHINECPNLLKYIKQIRSKYLADIVTVAEGNVILDRVKHLFINKEDGTVSTTLIKICAGIFACGTMIVYAVTHGLLEVGLSFSIYIIRHLMYFYYWFTGHFWRRWRFRWISHPYGWH